jgi:hypothetical protein
VAWTIFKKKETERSGGRCNTFVSLGILVQEGLKVAESMV